MAAGDAAAPSDLPLRMSCQAAGPLGAHAADTVLARVAGRRPEPLRIGFVALCLSLGRHDGIFQLNRRDDSATRFHLRGRAGAGVKELICRGTVKQMTAEARRPGTFHLPRFLQDPQRDTISGG
ncbi:hypothetical protein [Actinoplanes sp. NPDC023714]|uniref:hypothetical protein n=1 Tax=Actinoplanes sp. NPDC023714 TaxID=3154322 RepID=UPI0033F5B8CB